MATSKNYFYANAKVPPEKSTFAITCNRLSSFLKENANLMRDVGINANLDVKGKQETSSTTTTTVDLLSNMDSPVQTQMPITKSMNSYSLPQCQYVRLDSSDGFIGTNINNSSEPKTSQMTIFYGGRVYVFDCISADKAGDIMNGIVASGSNQIFEYLNCDAFRSEEKMVGEEEADGWDLPIARRASLHKFLAKRRDRATVRAPYQLHNPLPATSNHKLEFDLNLNV